MQNKNVFKIWKKFVLNESKDKKEKKDEGNKKNKEDKKEKKVNEESNIYEQDMNQYIKERSQEYKNVKFISSVNEDGEYEIYPLNKKAGIDSFGDIGVDEEEIPEYLKFTRVLDNNNFELSTNYGELPYKFRKQVKNVVNDFLINLKKDFDKINMETVQSWWNSLNFEEIAKKEWINNNGEPEEEGVKNNNNNDDENEFFPLNEKKEEEGEDNKDDDKENLIKTSIQDISPIHKKEETGDYSLPNEEEGETEQEDLYNRLQMLKDKYDLNKTMKFLDKIGYKEFAKRMLEPPKDIEIKDLKKHKYYTPKPEDIEDKDLWETKMEWKNKQKTKKL